MAVCLLDYSDLKMLAKVYDHTDAEALHSALSKTKSSAEAKRGTITAIVIKLPTKAVCVSL